MPFVDIFTLYVSFITGLLGKTFQAATRMEIISNTHDLNKAHKTNFEKNY